MELGFVKLSAACPQVKVGDVEFNLNTAKAALDRAEAMGCALLVLGMEALAVWLMTRRRRKLLAG